MGRSGILVTTTCGSGFHLLERLVLPSLWSALCRPPGGPASPVVIQPFISEVVYGQSGLAPKHQEVWWKSSGIIFHSVVRMDLTFWLLLALLEESSFPNMLRSVLLKHSGWGSSWGCYGLGIRRRSPELLDSQHVHWWVCSWSLSLG